VSVLVFVKVAANKAAFEKVVAERGDDMKVISTRGKAAGAIHLRFGLGADGTVVVLDEWNSAEAFMKFLRRSRDRGDHARLRSHGTAGSYHRRGD
jgi:heme-degrading monooxygenase HmoA